MDWALLNADFLQTLATLKSVAETALPVVALALFFKNSGVLLKNLCH